MKIVIFGASGATGHHLVNQALGQGYLVTAFVRDPSRLKISHASLRVIQGDVVDYKVVEQAVSGQDAVLSALGASSPFKYDQAVVDGVNNIIQAMETTGVQRFIYMSSAGVKQSRHRVGFVIRAIAPKILATEMAGHETREQMIRQSRLSWTIVRPPTLTNGKHQTQFRIGEEISSGGFTVTMSRADVADFMLRQLKDETFLRKSPLILY
jgi:putative NADH-flavin reductase